jgi:hypothetical protein
MQRSRQSPRLFLTFQVPYCSSLTFSIQSELLPWTSVSILSAGRDRCLQELEMARSVT